MSVELCTESELNGNNETTQVSTLGGSKPLHRFLRCQPKAIGTVVLIIGASSLVISIALWTEPLLVLESILLRIFIGILFAICGILFIVTELNLTKQNVTISLALSIVSIISGFWITMIIFITAISPPYDYGDEYINYTHLETELPWDSKVRILVDMSHILEIILGLFYLVVTIILIIMAVMGGRALRTTNTQASVMITVNATETPVE